MDIHKRASPRYQLFLDVLQGLTENGDPVPEQELYDELEKSGKFDRTTAKTYLRKLQEDGTVYEPQVGKFKKI